MAELIIMNITAKEYKELYKKASPKSPKLKDFFFAYIIGGFICAFGQILLEIYNSAGLGEENAKTMVPITLIFIAALLTALHLFDNIARVAGAGTLVPITGFANAVVSPAIEFKMEGRILGTGANMFKIAGPVIGYGTIASIIYGVAFWFFL